MQLAPAATAAARALVRVPGAAVVIRPRLYPHPSSPLRHRVGRIIPTRLYPHRQPVRAPWKSSLRRRRCKTFRSSLFEFTCHVLHPKVHSLTLFTPPFTASPRARLVVAAPSSPCCRAHVSRNRQHLAAIVSVPTTPSRRRPRAVVPASSSPRRRGVVTASSSPHRRLRASPQSSPYPHLYPHPMSSPVVVRPHLYMTLYAHLAPLSSSFLPVVAASSPRLRPCLSLPRPRVVVVVTASCRVAPASSPPSILTFILTSILTSVLTLSSPRRRLVASSSPSSLRRRVAVELSCHSAVVAAAFPASSPPRRLVSTPSSFHRAVIGTVAPRCTFVVAAPVFGASRCTVAVVVVPVVATLRCRRTAAVAQVVIATLRRRCSPAQHRHRRSRHRPLIRRVVGPVVAVRPSSPQSSSSPPSSSSHRRRPASRVARQHAGPGEPPPSEPSPSFPRRGLALGQHL